MRYTNIHRNIVLTAVASVILITASYVAFGWSDPNSAPPEASVSIPLDTGSVDQTKTGALKVKSLTTDEGANITGEIHATGDICTDVSGGKCLSASGATNVPSSLNAQDGTPGNAVYVDNDGNVGIGTTEPGEKLEINGNLKLSANAVISVPSGSLTIKSGGASSEYLKLNTNGRPVFIGETNKGAPLHIYSGSNDGKSLIISNDVNSADFTGSSGQDFIFYPGGTEKVRILSTGNVGIGTTSPVMPLDVNGAIKSKNYSVNIAEFNATDYGAIYGTDLNRHLVKIKTNFPYTDSSQMPALFIEGYDYGGGNTFGIDLVWYVYNGAFINYKASSYGSIAPKITLANEGGKVVILLEKPVGQRWYYSRFTIRALLSLGNPTWLQGWTFAPEPITGINAVVVPYTNAFENGYFSGNVGIGTTAPKSALHVPDGKYLQAEDNNAGAPPVADCDSDTERGRISLDTVNYRLYICAGAVRGWDYAALSN